MSESNRIYLQLRSLATSLGRPFQDVLLMYGIERSLARLSNSIHKDRFVLKGGMLLYLLYEGNYERSTTDIDLLHTNDFVDNLKLTDIFKEIFQLPIVDDGITYDLSALKIETKEAMRGIKTSKISVIASLNSAKLYLTFDVSYDDVVVPMLHQREMKILLGDSRIQLLTYSVESLIAEKLHVIVTFGTANTRVKDFYDIYKLCVSKAFDANHLNDAINETFLHRKMKLLSNEELRNIMRSEDLRRLWNAFIKAKTQERDLEFFLVSQTVLSLIPSNWVD